MDMEQKLFSVSKAAKVLGVTPKTIRVWDKENKLKVVLSPGGNRMIPIEEINKILGNFRNEDKR